MDKVMSGANTGMEDYMKTKVCFSIADVAST